MSFYILMNGELAPYQFDYLEKASQSSRLEKTLPRGTQVRTMPTPSQGKKFFAIEVMTKKPMYLSPTSLVPEVQKILNKKRIHHLPILENNKLVGMISDRDLIRVVDNKLLNLMEVKDIMSNILIAAHEETEISLIARVLIRENISALPIVNDQLELTGIISRVDILKLVIYNNFLP